VRFGAGNGDAKFVPTFWRFLVLRRVRRKVNHRGHKKGRDPRQNVLKYSLKKELPKGEFLAENNIFFDSWQNRGSNSTQKKTL